MSTRKERDAVRKARIAEIRDQQRRRERRRTLVIVGGAGVMVAVLIGAATFVIVGERQRQTSVEAAAKRPIEGVETFTDLTQNHVTEQVSYPQTPAVGGDHAPVWQDCGFYPQAIRNVQAVHSLEHGAVWIGYRPDLPQDQVDQLEQLTRTSSYLLVSPVQGVEKPAVATAWGKRLELDSVTDPRLAAFIRAYQQGPDTPEPGAACSGGSAVMGDG